MVSTISGGAPISVIAPPAASIAADAASDGSAPLSIAAVYASSAALPAASSMASNCSSVMPSGMPISSAILLSFY